MNRRFPVFVLVFASLAAMLVLGKPGETSPERTDASPVLASPGLPVAAPAGALTSTWFCAGGTGDEDAFADHTVIVANTSDQAINGIITVYGGFVAESVSGEEQLEDLEGEEGESDESDESDDSDDSDDSDEENAAPEPEPVTESLEIPALSRVEMRLGDVLEAELVSAVVELSGGAGVVEHRVESENGSDTAPCASEASTQWHFAWGATTNDARQLLVFFNPFPDDAVVDGFFITDDGPREPGRLDGLIVPSGKVVGIDLGDDITIRSQIAGSLRLRTGRVVVDRIQRFDGSAELHGLTVRAGVTAPRPLWVFPDGLIDEGITETLHIYNPTTKSAEVVVDIQPDDPAENVIPEPFEVSIQPNAQVTIDVSEDGRVEPGIGHSLTVRVLNDSAVVAERVLSATDPADRSGVSVTPGSPVAATHWIFAGGGTGDGQDEFITLLNPSNETPATVSISRFSGGQSVAIPGMRDLELPIAGRLTLRLGAEVEQDELPVIVESNEPVVAERGLYAAEGPGISNAIGIPLREGLVQP